MTSLVLAACLFASSIPTDEVVRTPAGAPSVRVVKNLRYGDRENLPDEGEGSPDKKIDEWGLPREAHETAQTYDVYYPANGAERAPIVLYIHGGAWMLKYDKNDIGFLATQLAERGWIVYSMNYIMPADFISGPKNADRPLREGATIQGMLRDIDLMTSRLKEDAAARGFSTERFALWGQSAGAHLASLYAYDADNPTVLGLGLKHALRPKALLNMVGPVDFSISWDEKGIWLDSDRMRSLIRKITAAEDGKDVDLKSVSPVHLLTRTSTPTVACYDCGSNLRHDGCIPVTQYIALTNRLESLGVPHRARLWNGYLHSQELITPTSVDWCFRMLKQLMAPVRR